MDLKVLTKRASVTLMLCMLCLVAFAQKTVSGLVKDTSGEPMIGVNVLVKGSTNGTITDFDGKFSIQNVPNNGILVVSYIGYLSQEVSTAGKNNVTVVLKEDNQTLDEVVVVGYGVVKKTDLTGSVGSVNSDKITAKGSTSVMEGLQGSVAGVNITQSSSRAGDGFSMQIRGKSSLQGGDPLYVIDGVVCENMNFLNPMDIEKVDVLKDASSTAIYGSRATNGVLMITTKKGTQGSDAKATVSYDGYYGVKKVANYPEFMSGNQFMKYRFSRYVTSTQNSTTGETTWKMTDSNFKNVWGAGSQVVQDMYKNNNYTNWKDLVTRDGSQQNHFVNVTGNAKNISYRFGLGYQEEKGVLFDSYNRWNIKGAIDHKINDHFSAGFSTNLATSLKNGGSPNGAFVAIMMTPVMPAYYWEGENAGQPILQPGKDAVVYPNGGGPTSTYSPLFDRENTKDQTRSYDAMANIYFQYTPIKDLILKTTFSPMYAKTHRGQYWGSLSQNRQGKSAVAESANDENISWTWDTQVNYLKTIEDHSFNLLGLVSLYDQQFRGDGISVTDMPFDVEWNNLGSGTVQSQSSYYKRISMLSYVLRLNYAYKGRYLFTVSSRWDGSSKFQKNNRWGCFPSAAFAWRINDESWMKSTASWLSNLKLRLSYGITGNNGSVGPYDTQSLANTKYYYNFGSAIANGYGYELTNSDLTWEKTSEFNVGLDFGFLNNRITGSIDAYHKVSKDLLMQMETPLELGSTTGAIWGNVGKVKNYGIEAQLSTVNYQDKDWNWTTSFTFAHNRNVIMELNGGKVNMTGNRWFIGKAIDVVYGYELDGVCTAEEAKAFAADATKKTKFYEGEMKIKDQDNNGTIDANDRIVMGHNAPTWTGSIGSNLTYKDFDFSFALYASQGGKIYSPFLREAWNYGSRGTQHMPMDYYIPAGAPILNDDGTIGYQQETHYGSYPYPTAAGNGGGGSFWTSGNENSIYFADNSFVKVKNITLGYSLPNKWISKFGASYLRLYLNILNPFTFTSYKGFDPEWAGASMSDGTGGPSSRSYQIGVNLKF